MNISLINGSPKVRNSASGVILGELEEYLEGHTIARYSLRTNEPLTAVQLRSLAEQDVLVLAFPLYVDGIPSHLLRHLVEMEACFGRNSSGAMMYAVANCGFYEGRQNRNALDMMKIWCEKAHVVWGQGVGVGGGGMIAGLENVPKGRGPRKNLSAALRTLADHVAEMQSADDLFVSPNFPRFLYKAMGEMGWRMQIRQNGLTRRDLFLRK